MKIYLVGISDCESTTTLHACISKELALKRWEEIRKELIESNKELWERHDHVMYALQYKNLQETDPEKMNNFPHDEPFIREMVVEE